MAPPQRHPENYDPEAQRRAIEDREGWPEYRRLVLGKLDDQREDLAELRDELREAKADIVGLKVKAAGWGFISGSISAILAAVLQYLSTHGR